jgi:LPS O-antigen subunit length determinant protein (WzzB/FepE family)
VDDLQKYLLENIDVSVAAPQTPNRNITFSFHDRQAAQNVLRWSLEEADRIIRESTESNVDKQIAYLENKLMQNNVASVANKSSLSDVLTEAEKSKILLVGGQPYAAEIINPVSVPDLPTFPKPSTFLILGALIGFVLGCGLTWLKIRFGIFGGVPDRVESVLA